MIPKFGKELRLRDVFSRKKSNAISGKNVFFLNSASECLVFFLRHIGQKLRVGVPIYTCSSVYNSIIEADCYIVFLDLGLDDDFTSIPRDLDVLIVTHYFGVVNNSISEIKRLYPNLIIVEDCSHVNVKFYKRDRHSDASIFSFNFHKPIALGIGGGIYVNTMYSNLKDDYIQLNTLNWMDNVKKISFILFKYLLQYKFIYITFYPIVLYRRKNDQNRHYNKIVPHRLNKFYLFLLNNLIVNFELCEKSLKRYSFFVNNDKSLITYSYFPIFFESKFKRDVIFDNLIKNKIEAFILWNNCKQHAKYYDRTYIFDSSKNTNYILDHILFIPYKLFSNDYYFYKFEKIVNN
ncbi:DegT/DnrJ/EryC1/StrS family aminotransferase [Acetobacteroides hydrogenigenes]|uniref:dTDP-4-amino-4,6-dideoxygalactose transaminase n=1 Tax=Acetobacteroides hydrogenigenes TaxID=979970 RepID=A0A4R2EE01_9BACT|nr:DegT/DnrJ/EryC1/StrS family aminotransferase [Acetobacteroides hydrogenigenes]TCN62209.1 hypothetical protein CLV25_11942 [Acetobacteroides hydrogenigenes]